MTTPYQHELRGVYVASATPFDQRGSRRPPVRKGVRPPRRTMPDEPGVRVHATVEAVLEVAC